MGKVEEYIEKNEEFDDKKKKIREKHGEHSDYYREGCDECERKFKDLEEVQILSENNDIEYFGEKLNEQTLSVSKFVRMIDKVVKIKIEEQKKK